MAFPSRWRGDGAALAAIVATCTLLALWLRSHGLASQVLLDDEWHAILKLMSASYAEIARSFGYADHSIPLTLLYKAMASTVGLDEIDLRALQVACGAALVPLAAWLAWRATRDAPVALLFAAMVAMAPLLVLYSRMARPYAITTLLCVACLAWAWRWRDARTLGSAAGWVLATAATTWLHPLTSLYPATAWLFVAAMDLRAGRRRLLQDLGLGVALAFAVAVPLAAPLLSDFASLWGKAGGQHASLLTVYRALAIFAGGLPFAAFVAMAACALVGAVAMFRRDASLGAYLLAIAVVPSSVIALLGAAWSGQGHTFGRYVFPLAVIFFFWASLGAITVVRLAARSAARPAAWAAAVVLAIAYGTAVPTFRQVATLGAWYAHIYHQYDYDREYNRAAHQYEKYPPPAFYRELGKLPPGSAPVIEAPFSLEAPANPFGYFDTFSRQPAKAGMLAGVCLDPKRRGEIPRGDPRFRFRDFVFLADPAATRASGARYLVLHREQIDGHPFPESAECIERLSALYGPPVASDAALAAWDLRRQQ